MVHLRFLNKLTRMCHSATYVRCTRVTMLFAKEC